MTSHKIALVLLVALCGSFLANSAQETRKVGQWYSAPEHWESSIDGILQSSMLTAVAKPSMVGGRYFYISDFVVIGDEPVVVDFKNTSVIGEFSHSILDVSDVLVTEAKGGIQVDAPNPFMLRHGRIFNLPEGEYKLVTEIASPYFIAHPEPYVDTLSRYQQSTKWGNLIALISLGVLLSMGVYYAILAYARKNNTEFSYSVFILMNFIFNGMTMLVFPDLLGIHWFYLAGAPILISNIAYMVFVMRLLEINAETHPKLYQAGRWIIYALVVLLVMALFFHHWMLEFARYGVGIMLVYGLVAGVTLARRGNAIARMYLFAIIAFSIIGSFTILSSDLANIYTIYIEHMGLLAVTVEVLLIGLVLGYQFAELHREKDHSLKLVQQSLKIAHTDALTGLPNRYALDQNLPKLTEEGVLVFIDMDNLKLYNDNFGHGRGDEMLKTFAVHLVAQLDGRGELHRIGGDEFAITSEADATVSGQCIDATMQTLHNHNFESAGASYGIAKRSEVDGLDALKELADARMYENKRSKKEKGSQLQPTLDGV